jgi:hypothetical protein
MRLCCRVACHEAGVDGIHFETSVPWELNLIDFNEGREEDGLELSKVLKVEVKNYVWRTK